MASYSRVLHALLLCTTLFSWMEYMVVANNDSDSTSKYVTCGSAIKLKHLQSGGNFYLYSENARNQGRGASGQQLVTFSPHHKNSAKTLWLVQASHNSNCTSGAPIHCGSEVRLGHVETKRNLHTHQFVSSLSRQQEVTAWGDNYQGDGGDDWVVICKDEYWKRDATFRLQHRDTRQYLGAADNVKYQEKNCGAECPILNHLEAFARKRGDEYGDLQVESGLFIGG